MFRRNKAENKAKLEHKLYLARESPEPVFDISECDLRHVPPGIYSLCRVFLKEVLRLENNCLTSLDGGGQLKDLYGLNVLSLHHNAFVNITDDIKYLKNLKELYLNDNQLKKLPESIGTLVNLKILDVSGNVLKKIPDGIGDLSSLRILNISRNKGIKELPKSMCGNQALIRLDLDYQNFIYPPSNILQLDATEIIKYICNDVGEVYDGNTNLESFNSEMDETLDTDHVDAFEAKIWTLETIKKQKLQQFLEMEKANEILQRQEFELALANKSQKEQLLSDLVQQQNKFDVELMKLQQMKEMEKFNLIEQVIESEHNADVAIKQLLQLSQEPLAQLLEQEKQEEERLIATANKYNNDLKKQVILADMQLILQQELDRFQKFDRDRIEVSKSILEQEMQSDSHLAEFLQNQDTYKNELVAKLQEDSDLQKAAVGTLLERGDARSWGLIQQVKLVESQLVALTQIEMERKKLEIDEQMNDLCENRVNLSILLMDLLEQQKERRAQLLSTLQTLEAKNIDTVDDFWLQQYQRLLENLPSGLSEAQKNMDPTLAQSLLLNGVIHCLPFLAKLTQCEFDVSIITEEELSDAGIVNKSDRTKIIDAFHMYTKEKMSNSSYGASAAASSFRASAPPSSPTEASAPSISDVSFASNECVVCMDRNSEIIFLPCGHLCCCRDCAADLSECPMCRAEIEKKVRVTISS